MLSTLQPQVDVAVTATLSDEDSDHAEYRQLGVVPGRESNRRLGVQ